MIGSQATANTAFLNSITPQAKHMILENIAAHYGITTDAAFEEVTQKDAESLLDYVTGPERAATSVLMQAHSHKNGQIHTIDRTA